MENIFSPLINLIRSEKVTLFLGAGFSLKAGAPSCQNICNSIIAHSPNEYQDSLKNMSLDILCDEFIQLCNGDRSKLISILKELFRFEKTDLSDHNSLKNIPHFHRLFTTNYDDLLETTYGAEATIIRTNEEAIVSDFNKVLIYKIHGDFENPNDLLISKQDYVDFYRNQHNPLLWDIVKSEFISRPILFIGYSLEDDNIAFLLERIQQESQGKHQPIFLIAPNLKQYKVQRLQNLGVTYFNAYADEFFDILNSELKENIVSDLRSKIVSINTFIKFCKIHNIEASVCSKENETFLTSATSTNFGKHNISFTSRNDVRKQLEDIEGNANYSFPIYPSLAIPCIKLSGDNLINFRHTLNDVTINTDSDRISLLIAPQHKLGKGKLIVPSERLIEEINFVKYYIGTNSIKYRIELPIGMLEVVSSWDAETKQTTSTFTYIPADKLTSLYETMHWVSGLRDIWECKIFKLEGIINHKGFLNFPKNVNNDVEPFNSFLEYCDNIQDIEFSEELAFNVYDGYSDENLEKSRTIYAFLNEKAIKHECHPKTQIIITLNNLTELDIKRLQVGCIVTKLSIFERVDKNISFCGKNFLLPFKYSIFKKCKVISFVQEDGAWDIKLNSLEPIYYEYFTVTVDANYTPGLNTIKLDFPDN